MFSLKQLLRMLALQRHFKNLHVCYLLSDSFKKPFGKDPHPAGCSGLQETLLFVPKMVSAGRAMAPGLGVNLPAALAHQETLTPRSVMDHAETKVCSKLPYLHSLC